VRCQKTLALLLAKYCPTVTVVAQCGSGAEGLHAIRTHAPDVVFLDVEMPVMNGFAMLEQVGSVSFALIFTTGYDAYAIKAIRYSALDYLLKPIDKEELQQAVAKLGTRPAAKTLDPWRAEQLALLLNQIGSKPTSLQKIALPTLHGFELVALDAIIRCEADDNYTYIHLKTGKAMLVSRTLKEVEELLEGRSFLRVHQSHVVNLNEIARYYRGRGGYVVMSDESTVSVAQSRKDELLKMLQV
jgi:two-component system LytT family response regulator